MATCQVVGIVAAGILAPFLVWAQVATETNPTFSPPTAVSGESATTNAPEIPFRLSAQPPVFVEPMQPPAVVEPMRPPITIPQPMRVDIPSATAPPSVAVSAPVSISRSAPLNIPTSRDLIAKSMTSAPGGSQEKLNAISSGAQILSPTNSAGSPLPSSNSSTNQADIWHPNNPALNGVEYHW